MSVRLFVFFFSSRRRHTRCSRDWSSDVCSSDLSLFHGREPDENRWDFDFGPLDSWSARLSANPTAQTSFQLSYGFLHGPEALRPDQDLHRWTASAAYTARTGAQGILAVAAIWGRNVEQGHGSDSALLEGNLD